MAKAEHLGKGASPRFIVTSLSAEKVAGRELYETIYWARPCAAWLRHGGLASGSGIATEGLRLDALAAETSSPDARWLNVVLPKPACISGLRK